MSVLANMVKQKWLTPPQESTESFTGRTVLVTGATSGLGYVAAAKFALLDASKVIISARSLSQGNSTKASLEALTNKTSVFEVQVLNMCSYTSVASFAQRVSAGSFCLDIVILNAGVRKTEYMRSEHGWEEDLQVNVLSPILLGMLLLPKLKLAQSHTGLIPVLQFVNSGLHERASIPDTARKCQRILAVYNRPDSFGAQRQYSSSKLLLMLATVQLAARVDSADVIVTSTCPGVVASNLGRDVKFPGISVILAVMSVTVQRTAEQGANTYVSGARQDRGLHGRLWKNDEIRPVAPTLQGIVNEEVGRRVWDEIIEDLVKHVPEMKGIVKGL